MGSIPFSYKSAIGIGVVEDGRIVDEFFSLVDPEQPFDWFNAQLTGINEETVFDAPAFPEVWERIEPLIKRFLGYDRGEDGNLVINPEQAEVVKRI